MYKLKIFRSISQIQAEDWDRVSGGKELARSHAYLSAVEEASVNDAEYFYPVIFRNEIPIAHCCVYTISTDFQQMLPVPLQKLVSFLRKEWPILLLVKVTES